MFVNAVPALLPERPAVRVLAFTVLFLILAYGYATLGRAVLRRLASSARGRRVAPALCGAGLGVWIAIIWAIFSRA